MSVISLGNHCKYPLVFRVKGKWAVFRFAIFGTGSQEGDELLSRYTGTCWGNSMSSISEALLHLVWLYQPRESMKWSTGGSMASLWGSLVSEIWVQASEQRVLQKHHLPNFPPLPRSPAWDPAAHSAEAPMPPASDPSYHEQKVHYCSLSLLLLWRNL